MSTFDWPATEAFGYCRVSGKGQLDGDGMERQRIAIDTYSVKSNIKIVAWYEEKGVCGATEWEDRPAWSNMVESLNGVRTIVVERLDRLARELMIQEYILRDLKKRGVVLLTAAEEDTSDADPTRVMFRQILGAIAQYDRTMTVRKLAGARRRMRERTGKCEGPKFYGEDPLRPHEKEIAALIRTLRNNGDTLDSIAERLNTQGIKPRRGLRWYGSAVNYIASRKVSENHNSNVGWLGDIDGMGNGVEMKTGEVL